MVNASVAFTVSKGIFGLEEDEDGWYRYTLSSTHLWYVRYPHKIGWTIEVLWSCLRGVAIALEKDYPGLYFGYFFHDVDSITVAHYDLEHIKKDRSGDGPIDVESYLDSNRSSSFSQALWWASGLIIFNPDNGDLSASVDRSRIFTSHVESWIEDFVSYVVSLIKLKIQTEITQKENAFALAEADLSWTRAHYNQISRA